MVSGTNENVLTMQYRDATGAILEGKNWWNYVDEVPHSVNAQEIIEQNFDLPNDKDKTKIVQAILGQSTILPSSVSKFDILFDALSVETEPVMALHAAEGGAIVELERRANILINKFGFPAGIALDLINRTLDVELQYVGVNTPEMMSGGPTIDPKFAELANAPKIQKFIEVIGTGDPEILAQYFGGLNGKGAQDTGSYFAQAARSQADNVPVLDTSGSSPRLVLELINEADTDPQTKNRFINLMNCTNRTEWMDAYCQLTRQNLEWICLATGMDSLIGDGMDMILEHLYGNLYLWESTGKVYLNRLTND